MSTSTAMAEPQADWVPRSLRFSHINLPSRDFAQSRRFFCDVLGGKLIQASPLMRIRFANFDVVLAAQQVAATAPHLEYPHYAFTVRADQFAAWKRRLEGFGIPTHDPWTRKGETHTIMYFRDPTGNQFEFFAPEGDTGLKLRLGNRAGGDYVVPYLSLGYAQLKDPAPDTPALPATPLEYNHMTIPSKDFGANRRFLIEVLGCKLNFDIPNIHVTVVVGGVDIGYGGPADEQWPWPAPDCAYPRNTLLIAADELRPVKERLARFGVPSTDIWTANGQDAVLYFRDPSSNLWELYCSSGCAAATQRGAEAGGNYVPDLKALYYTTWKDPH